MKFSGTQFLQACCPRIEHGLSWRIRKSGMFKSTFKKNSRKLQATQTHHRARKEKRCWRTAKLFTTDLHLMPHYPPNAQLIKALFYYGGRTEYSGPLLPLGTMSLDQPPVDAWNLRQHSLLWEPYIVLRTHVLPYTYRPMTEFNLQSRHTKRSAIVTTNKIEKIIYYE